MVDRLFEDIEAKPQISCENEEDQVIAGLVAGGFGIAVVPYIDSNKITDIIQEGQEDKELQRFLTWICL